MAPPASVDLIGSYPLGTCTKPHIVVDLAVTIPAVRFFKIILNITIRRMDDFLVEETLMTYFCY